MGKEQGYRVEKDVDFHNQRLWKRKIHKKQQDKDHKRKVYKQFGKAAEQPEQEVDAKQKEFYEALFKKDADAPVPLKKSKKQPTFNQQLDKIAESKVSKEEARELQKQQLQKKLKDKHRYSKQLQRKNSKGQPVMSAMLGHYLTKIQGK